MYYRVKYKVHVTLGKATYYTMCDSFIIEVITTSKCILNTVFV